MVRKMTIEDYDKVYALWMSIHGFGIRTMDDSREGIERCIKRNPETSAVYEKDGKIVGAILCGNDGRRACFYHVCVSEAYRKHGIGRKMGEFCCEQLKKEGINKVCLNACVTNEVGNKFWQKMGWTLRDDMNYYDFTLNESTLTDFNK